MNSLSAQLDQLAQEQHFSGVVQLNQNRRVVYQQAYGLAHRSHGIPNTVHTQFGLASFTKVFTALTVLSLVAEGRLRLATPAREFLNDDLPMIHADVTVEQLLSHRSGIGDYLDEDAERTPNDSGLSVPVQQLSTTEQYVPILDGHPMKFAPGTAFSYCNSGYVVLALLIERCTGQLFPEAVYRRVSQPAGLTHTAFLRSDELPAGAATGYLSPPVEQRSNVFHLPVAGSGDGGIYSTAQDVHRLWQAWLSGTIVPPTLVRDMRTPRSIFSSGEGYGLGLWLTSEGDEVLFRGMDPGVSCVSRYIPELDVISTVMSNTAEGAWPINDLLSRLVPEVHIESET